MHESILDLADLKGFLRDLHYRSSEKQVIHFFNWRLDIMCPSNVPLDSRSSNFYPVKSPIERPSNRTTYLFSEVVKAILRCKTLFFISKIAPFLAELWPFYSYNLLQPPHTTDYLLGSSIRDFR